ncbi:MAG: acyl carrier protein [Desulfobacteraceae bacterium]|nr:acyl carrier protein [Desulfobacteraceae bacterium]
MKFEQKVKQIISKLLEIDINEINDNDDNSLHWDSLTHIKIIVALEEKFGVVISPADIIKMQSYKNMIDKLKLYLES